MFELTSGRRSRSPVRVGALAALVVACVLVPMTATAAVYPVSGSQVTISETESTMTGGLNGGWTTVIAGYRFDEQTGRLVAWGTESFSGCLDLRRNGCDASDPAGTMSFRFTAWQKYDPLNGYSFVTGACIHPVTGGTAGFRGAHGVIAMKDTPHADGTVSTSYAGVLDIPAGPSTKSVAGASRAMQATTAPRVTCGG